MLSYVFWHRPNGEVSTAGYEKALLEFHRVLGGAGRPGLKATAVYRIDETPWLQNKMGYADWYLLEGSWAMDALNSVAVSSRREAAHDDVASQSFEGYGGLYDLITGEPEFENDLKAVWLTRPRGVDYWADLGRMVEDAGRPDTCWRRRMVLGPAPEFAIIGEPGLEVTPAEGWVIAAEVERIFLGPT